MLLQHADGKPFAAGSTRYDYRPATDQERTPRITVEIEVAGLHLTAFVDTGGVYFLCPPAVARHFGLHLFASVGQERLLVRGQSVRGELHRIPLTFLAAQGEDVTIDATVLVPQDEHVDWSSFPCILGMQGCLERLCFAVDPANEMFYFGETS